MTLNMFPENFINEAKQSIQLPSAKTWTKHPVFTGLFGYKNIYAMYDRPTTRKVAKVAAYALGIGFAVAACFTPTIPAAIGLAVAGVSIIGITYLVSRILNCLIPMRHDMKDHAFRPEKLEKNGILLGQLYYDKDVPVLKIESSDPYEMGYVHGHLLGKKIWEIRHNINFCIHTLSRFAKPSELSKVLDLVKSKIPQQYLKELEGIVDGYNAKKSVFEKALTLDDLVFLQLMPDMHVFSPQRMLEIEKEGKALNQASPLQVAVCSLSALYDKNQIPLLARTMDWQSFGNIGTFSLIVSRINPTTGIRTAEVAVPGLLGVVTGVNNHGVCVAMNVTPYSSEINKVEGIPSAFYNRLILDNCTSFDDAEQFVASNQPIGPYHLTISDKTKAGTFSMYQKEDFKKDWDQDKHNGHLLRRLEEQTPLITTNCACNENGEGMFHGKTRKEALNNYLQATSGIMDPRQRLVHSQTIPLINNSLSTHRVIMGSNTLEVAFDNAWAGDRELHTVDLEKLFS